MNFAIRGQNLLLTDALKDYASKKIGRLERYFEAPPTADVHITLSVAKNMQTVEVTIPLPGVLLRAEERSEDMYASIDLVAEKLERQIRKHKTKANRKFRHDGIRSLFSDSYDSSTAVRYLDEEDDDLELVRTKRFNLKPMDVEEAILQMNMVGHSFFVFANADSKQVNVVYRRNDGKYGLIEPN
ncbi:ribosome hibernation-promoting factor, HPF/YfiA family [Paenibacillus flagellatus]|uniref:Ribosome hibernation promoting factor n=1 Tax=Paenibacillus flagellatus TaxID=2211139 RepID=A0A2V5KQZ2_9BACL|nr:ribosome-associated translation inhibitor RaiA [Paenibacillus flagellatus]PYI51186.1 ribosome-associated translation inhibitor RaiA [Paenibacillus flagellatus]